MAPKKKIEMKQLPKEGKSSKVEKVIQDITNRYRVTAREARDIVTAVGGIKDVVTNMPGTIPKGGTARQIKNAVKNVATQVKETGTAAKTGQAGKPSKQYTTRRGDDPATFYGKPKRK
jgi:hypothetical protein